MFFVMCMIFGTCYFIAKFICSPKEYSDSLKWKFSSAMQLIILLHESESFRPMLKALQRMLKVKELLRNNNLIDLNQVKISKL